MWDVLSAARPKSHADSDLMEVALVRDGDTACRHRM